LPASSEDLSYPSPMLILDAHLDLAMNALEWNRDFTRSVHEIRERERDMTDKPDRARGTVSFEEMRRGRVGVCVATQIARCVAHGNPLPGWHSAEQAWAQTQGQLAWYRSMEGRGELAQIRTRAQLQGQVAKWSTLQAGAELPIGFVLSLEGADSLVSLGYLERAYGDGLRALGPAHYGPGRYANGTPAVVGNIHLDTAGPFPPAGRELLREMDRLGMILDVTHLTDEEFWEAIDLYRGPIWASHSDCRALTPHQRQLDDDQIRALIDRGAVIGAALDAWMMVPNWVRRQTTPQSAGVTLSTLVDHIDHVCQIAGNASHSMIGSDLDGGFGKEQTALDLETIADLSRIPDLLRTRGYREQDVTAIACGNAVGFLERALPE
jgi:membrane dipeptidase